MFIQPLQSSGRISSILGCIVNCVAYVCVAIEQFREHNPSGIVFQGMLKA
jgi:hypothetical protein